MRLTLRKRLDEKDVDNSGISLGVNSVSKDCPNCGTGVIKDAELRQGRTACNACYKRKLEENRLDTLHKSLQRANERAKML